MPGNSLPTTWRTLSASSWSLAFRLTWGTRFTLRFPACGPVLAVKIALRPSGRPVSEIMVVTAGEPSRARSPRSVRTTASSSRAVTFSVCSTRVPMGVL